MRLLFEEIYREAPQTGLLGISSNNGFPRISQSIRDLGWLGRHHLIQPRLLVEVIEEREYSAVEQVTSNSSS